MKHLLICFAMLSSIANAYERMLVMHSQSTTPPTCPSNSTEMWKGYSLFGYFLSNGYRSAQDLSQPGSCQEKFHPLPFIRCNKDGCDYNAGSNTSIWLGVNAPTDTEVKYTQYTTGFSGAPAIASSSISRCTVCEVKTPIITKHSFNDSEASCPTGWHSLWKGYSFGSAARWDWGFDSGQQLGDSGSCLPIFDPNPAYQCWIDHCDKFTTANYQMWMLNMNTGGDTSLKYNNTEDNRKINRARISQCNVCAKN